MSDDVVDCQNCRTPVNKCECGDAEISCHYRIVCPYCAHEHEPEGGDGGDDYEEETHDKKCMECGKTFNLRLDISHEWTATRPEDQEL